ncbi:MAG: hypothetical protein WBE59_07380 [Candidatus Cybelea sp.]
MRWSPFAAPFGKLPRIANVMTETRACIAWRIATHVSSKSSAREAGRIERLQARLACRSNSITA